MITTTSIETPCLWTLFDRVWTDYGDKGTPSRAYMVEGGAVFAKDRERFYKELLHLQEKESCG